MASFGKRVDGPGGRRRIKRKLVSIQGSASTEEGSRSVIIENLCFGGARVLGHDLPTPGSQILLRRSDRSIEGRVVWSEGNRRGILFNGGCRPQSR